MPAQSGNEMLVPVPLGGGIDREAEEFLLEAPRVRLASNLTLKSRGALQKRAGWAALNNGSIGAGANTDILFRARDTLAVFSDDRNKIYRDGLVSELGRYQPSFRILSHPAFAAIGTVHTLNLAHLDGYTAVVASVHDNPTDMANNNYQSVRGVYAILDADWNVVFGPRTSDLIGILPRVEAMRVSGAPAFMFLGMRDTGTSATAYWLGAPTLKLSAIYATPTGTQLTYTSLDDVLPYQRTAAEFCICYDTHCSGEAAEDVFLAYYIPGGGTPLRVARLSAAGSLTTLDISGTGASPDSMAVWHDASSGTVLVYSEETGTLYYGGEALASVASVAHPGSAPSSTTSVVTSLATWPVFWKDGAGQLVLTDRPVTITGSGPGTPAFGAQRTIGTLHARPIPRGNDDAFFFSDHLTFNASQGIFVQGGKMLEVVAVDDTNASEYVAAVAPLHGTRRTLDYKTGWFKRGFSSGNLGTMPQSAQTAEGKLLRADAIVTSGFLPYVKTRSKVVGHAAELETGLGALSDSLSVVVTEIDPTSTEYSFQDHFGTALLANGNLSAYDGNQVCPIAIRKPPVELLGSTFWAVAPLTSGWDIAANSDAEFAVTLSYIDRNNVRFRWLVSRSTIENEDPDSPIAGPIGIAFQLFPSELEHLAEQGLLTAEFWGGLDYVHGGTPLEDLYVVGRAPVVWDASGSQWIADPGNLNDPAVVTNPTPYPYATEAIPALIPSTTIVQKVANYVFCVASEAPAELWVSKPFGPYQAPEFPAEFMITSPAEAGEIRSLATAGDHLLALCEHGVWELYVGGGGPDANGDGAFPAFSLVYKGSGAITHRGTVSGDWGTLYMSADGVKLIRGSELMHIGERVRGLYVPEDVRAAVFDEAEREVWLFFDGADALVLDVDLLEWTTATVQASAAVARPGNITRLDTGGRLCERDETRTQDADDSYLLSKVVSPWLHLGSPMGYKRFRRIGALMRRIAGTVGGIRISVAYGYVDTDVDVFTFGSGLAALERGMQFVSQLTRQKTDAIRITLDGITEGVDEPDGEGGTVTVQRNDLRWSLAALSVRAEEKAGHIKLQAEAKS